jgi:hypothetical protein
MQVDGGVRGCCADGSHGRLQSPRFPFPRVPLSLYPRNFYYKAKRPVPTLPAKPPRFPHVCADLPCIFSGRRIRRSRSIKVPIVSAPRPSPTFPQSCSPPSLSLSSSLSPIVIFVRLSPLHILPLRSQFFFFFWQGPRPCVSRRFPEPASQRNIIGRVQSHINAADLS